MLPAAAEPRIPDEHAERGAVFTRHMFSVLVTTSGVWLSGMISVLRPGASSVICDVTS